MKNKKIKVILSSILLGSFTLVPVASVLAEESASTASTTTTTTVVNATSTKYLKGDFKKWVDGFKNKKNDRKDQKDDKKNEMKDKRDEWKNSSSTMSSITRAEMLKKMEERKAAVAKKQLDNATESLVKLSTKLGTLGTQIRAIVNGQASSSDAIAQAMDKVEGRGNFRKFMFGSDYKNFGQIVSEVSKIQARVNQLDRQVSKMATSTDKTTAQASIKALKDQIVTLEQYVKDNINKFSLFGWFFHRFNK